MASNTTIVTALRALQLLFATIVIGTVAYGIHIYSPYTTHIYYVYGDFDATFGVPNAWGYLLFCALWTILAVIFAFVHSAKLASNPWLGYAGISIEAIALLSWLTGFIAVAVSVGSDICSAGSRNGKCCGTMTAAAVFGAFEWLLFTITATITITPILNSVRGRGTPTMRPGAVWTSSGSPRDGRKFDGGYGSGLTKVGGKVAPPYDKAVMRKT